MKNPETNAAPILPPLLDCALKRCSNKFYQLTSIMKYCSPECSARARQKEYEIRNRDRMALDKKIRQERQRLEALTLLGLKCCRCGFSDYRALQIDHKNGRNRTKRESWSIFYTAVLKSPLTFQLLCANCNWIKRYEDKEVTGRPRVDV